MMPLCLAPLRQVTKADSDNKNHTPQFVNKTLASQLEFDTINKLSGFLFGRLILSFIFNFI